jgi:ATP-binding cassette subfamily F protein 3
VLLSATDLRLSFGARTLLDGTTFRLDRGERVGLVGDNGAGKTTLLRCLTGEIDPDAGQVSTARAARVGYLKQDPDFPGGQTAIDVAEAAFEKLHDLAHRLRDLEHRMADAGDELEAVMNEYETVGHAFDAAGGYAWRHRVEAALDGVGLDRSLWETDVDRLSGGQRSRLQLARLLVDRPDVLLLDEPTNHLDLAGIEWLENELLRHEGAILLVSHDRFLLDRLATRIDHLWAGRVAGYPGNYAAFVRQRAQAELSQQRAYEKQQRDVAKQAEFVRRFKAGQRAREAKGREKRLNRLLASDAMIDAVADDPSMSLKFAVDKTVGSDRVLRVEALAKSYGELGLWQGVRFDLKRGERVGIVGPNGCGKTTLLRCLVGEADADAGEIRWGTGLSVGYYDQRLEDFDADATAMDELYTLAAAKGMTEPQLRTLMGAMRFSGDDAFKRMGDLSGGERARVAMTKLLLERANVLLLDEPTNHLDVATRDALEGALTDYEGTLVAVSHDRYFLRRVTDRLLVFEPPKLIDFAGNWDAWLARRTGSPSTPSPAKPAKSPKSGSGRPEGASKNKYLRPFGTVSTADLESRITDTEVELADTQQAMADGRGMSDPAEARRLASELERLAKELAQLEEEYFSRDA